MQCVRPLYKTEVLAVIVVARLHSPATSHDQYSSHQICSMAQANISVTTPYVRDRRWKAAKPSYIEYLFSAEHGLVTMSPTDGSIISRHLSTPRWHPKSEIEWHVGLANDLIRMRSPSSNAINYKYYTSLCTPM